MCWRGFINISTDGKMNTVDTLEFSIANGVEPDEMLQYGTSYRGVHCLFKLH